jgi:hypothetical protein
MDAGRQLAERLRPMRGRRITAVRRLAVAAADGAIPLTGMLVLETGGEYVVLSCAQDGLSVAAPAPRPDLRWPTEPELSTAADGAGEWLDLAEVEDDAVLPPLPLGVGVIDVWTVAGDYLAGAVLSFSLGNAELVVASTDAFDLVCVDRSAALAQLDALAAALSLPVVPLPDWTKSG